MFLDFVVNCPLTIHYLILPRIWLRMTFLDNSLSFPCHFTDTVRSDLRPHQPVLLHDKVRLPESPLDPPHLDVRHVLLPALLQLLATGLH